MKSRPENIAEFLPIVTKLNPPQNVKQFIPRIRLDCSSHLLKNDCKVIFVHAPAGYGKTVLLTQWFQVFEACDISTAWLSFDSEDNSMNNFFSYFLAALKSFDSTLIQPIQTMLFAENIVAYESIAIQLINKLDKQAVLFIDDVHFITDRKILMVLQRIITHAPSQFVFILASKNAANIELWELLVQGKLIEYDAQKIRFTLDESVTYLRDYKKLSINNYFIDLLYQKTEGWVVALQLAGLVINNHIDASEFIEKLSGIDGDISAYLTEVVISQQSQQIQCFLMQTSILDRFCIESCSFITDVEDTPSLLDEIISLNLFLVPLDREKKWYRYHQLFSDYLRGCLKQESVDEFNYLSQRASQWFDENNFNAEAIHYALASEDYDRAASLLSKYAMKLIQVEGNHGFMMSWINKLPESYIDQYPMIRCFYVHSLLMSRDYDQFTFQFKKLVQNQKTITNRPNDEIDLVHSFIELSQCIFAGLSADMKSAIELSQQWIAKWSSINLPGKHIVLITLGIGYIYTGEFKQAYQVLMQAVVFNKSHQQYQAYCWSVIALHTVLMIQGKLTKALTICQAAVIEVEAVLGSDNFLTAMINLRIAIVMYEQGKVDNAHKLLLSNIKHVGLFDVYTTTVECYTVLAKIASMNFNIDQAHAYLNEGINVGKERECQRITLALVTEKIRLYLNHNQLAKAVELADEYQFRETKILLYKNDINQKFYADKAMLVRIYFALFHHDMKLALYHLDQLINQVSLVGNQRQLMKALVLKTITLIKMKQNKLAKKCLFEVLTQGQAGCHVQLFIEEMEYLKPLIDTIYFESINEYCSTLSIRYLGSIVRAINVVNENTDTIFDAKNYYQHILTNRELSIIHLMQSGMLYKQIAERLCISENTLKWHIRNLYKKLGVSNRSGAVQKAQELLVIEK